MKNKEELQSQIESMKQKLVEMEALLNEPEVSINYWQPKDAENLYYVNYTGKVISANYSENYQEDKTRYKVFKTKEEAEKYAEYVKAEETLKRVITEANAGWLPDWSNYEPKYVIGCVFKIKHIKVLTYLEDKLFTNFMYIKSRELAEKLMKEYEAEFKTYLSY